MAKKFTSLKEDYIKLVCEKLLIKKEDLTQTEKEIIEFSFQLIEEKLLEIKDLNEEPR